MASPVYCWDEEAPQNDRTRTGPNRLVFACGFTVREMTRRLGRSPCKVLNYQTPLEIFTAHIEVFGWTLELRRRCVSKRFLFETMLLLRDLAKKEICRSNPHLPIANECYLIHLPLGDYSEVSSAAARITSTRSLEWRTTRSAMLPRSQRPTPERP